MAGGLVKQGRVDNKVLNEYMAAFDPFFEAFMRYKREWTGIISYMQRLSAPVKGVLSLDVEGDYYLKAPRSGVIAANEGALRAFEEIGFIKNLKIESGKRVSLSFASLQTRAWLRDIGSVLETYVYKACRDIGVFNNVASSVVVAWEGGQSRDEVTNELDAVAVRDITPVFISCKTCEINTEALNELKVLKDRFGSGIARAAIVSAKSCQSVTRHRASELGISVIELDDLKKGRLKERLSRLI